MSNIKILIGEIDCHLKFSAYHDTQFHNAVILKMDNFRNTQLRVENSLLLSGLKFPTKWYKNFIIWLIIILKKKNTDEVVFIRVNIGHFDNFD